MLPAQSPTRREEQSVRSRTYVERAERTMEWNLSSLLNINGTRFVTDCDDL